MDMNSVLQDWVMKLPLREQGSLLTAVRGCDNEPKTWVNGHVVYSQARRLTSFIRWCFMVPADPREVDYEEGSFISSVPPDPFNPSAFGHLPQHWYGHVMHALEVIGYRHPNGLVRIMTYDLYYKMVHNLHLLPESAGAMIDRLGEDRIKKGRVTS